MRAHFINGQVIRRRRQQLGAHGSLRAFARMTGLTGPSLRTIETLNQIQGETPLYQLVRIAEVLGVPLTDLLQEPASTLSENPYELGDESTLAADVTRLGRLLQRDSRLLKKVAIATIFEWDKGRLRAAQEALDAQLRPVGITVYELTGAIALRPVDSSGDDDADRVAAYRVASDGMDIRQARLLHDVMTGRLNTNNMLDDRMNFLGSLMNLGIVYHERFGGTDTHRLTADAAYAFDISVEAGTAPVDTQADGQQ